MKLPEIIPLFPLPNVVLFPGMPLPLHVFEPRYRAMVRDALRGAHLVGMVLLKGDWQAEYHARPQVFSVGTVGEVVHVDELPDGRFNIVLRGLREFHIHRELARAPYREAVVSWRGTTGTALAPGLRGRIRALVDGYLAQVGRTPADGLRDGGVDDETFVNFLAQHLDIEPLERQALLEAADLGQRGRCLVDVLEFRLRELRSHPQGSPGRGN
ncbi:MAG: LON peptidase substrate-binding domain-containing protein [bacterium]|nr:LON peptidase substrate-binding domain-containing protein [bacterium]